MAVSKTFPPEQIREAYQAGLRLFGENRVQEFAHKWPALRDLADAEWHLIGHLQTNKASKAAELFAAIDSLDSSRLAEKLNLSARLLGRKLPVLIEINMGEEAAKSGLAAESPAQWAKFVKKYKAEMATPQAQHDLELLAVLSHTTDFSVGCYCQNEDHCHRSILKQLLIEKGAKIE